MGFRTHRGFVRLRKFLLASALLAALDIAISSITVTESVPPSLGLVLAGGSGRQFILNTDETVSGANAADYLVGAVSGQLDVKQTGGPASGTLLADNIMATGVGGITTRRPVVIWGESLRRCKVTGHSTLASISRRAKSTAMARWPPSRMTSP